MDAQPTTPSQIPSLETIFDAMSRVASAGSFLGISYDVEPDGVECRLTLDARHGGAPGVAHGGIVSTLLDNALGARALLHGIHREMTASTVELKVNFLRPALLGRTLVTETTMQSAGRSLLVISGKAIDEESGEAVAFAVGTFNLYPMDREKMRRAFGI